jgi:hypothetical protein
MFDSHAPVYSTVRQSLGRVSKDEPTIRLVRELCVNHRHLRDIAGSTTDNNLSCFGSSNGNRSRQGREEYNVFLPPDRVVVNGLAGKSFVLGGAGRVNEGDGVK